MTIYYFLVLVILVLNVLRKRGNISDKTFTIVCCTMFVMIVGLRGKSVGADTWNYHSSFYSYADFSLPEVIALNKRDYLFFIVQWFIVHYLHEFVFLNLIAAAIYYIPLSVLLYERSDDIGLSYLTLMAFTFFQFSMTGTRQTMAFGFAILALREILKDRPYFLKFLLWVFIGTGFHRSCIVTLMYLPMRWFIDRKQSRGWLIPIAAVCYFFRSSLTTFIISVLAPDEAYKEFLGYTSGGGTTTYAVFILLLLAGLILLPYDDIEETNYSNAYFVIFGLAAAMQAFVMENSIMFRVVWYFSIILTLLIPNFISSSRITSGSKPLFSGAIYAGLIFMYFGVTITTANVVPYVLF